MIARYDRVIRQGAADGKNVYSLSLDSDGLYVFYTGIVGGLVLDHRDNEPHIIVVDEQTMPLIESMIKSEARVHSVPPEELVKEGGHTLLPFASITAVRENGSALVIETDDDRFDFYFTLSNDIEVAELAERLGHAVEDSHANH